VSREFQVTSQLVVNVPSGPRFQGFGSGSFTVDLTGSFAGPAPGTILVPLAGVDVDLSLFTTPGLAYLYNLDTANFVEVGIKEPATGFFYPFLEIGPLEGYPIKLSRNLGEEYTGTGTGTSAATNTLHAKANTAPCKVFFGVFER
jgi:hypothetical protein